MVITDLRTDVLVVGSGLAGILFALELAQQRQDLKILVTSKRDKQQSSSWLAQGGIAAVLPDSEDSIEQHIKDTCTAGAYENDAGVVAYFVSRSPAAIQTLEKWGVKFDQNAEGQRTMALEGGHSLPRVLHHKDFTGRHIMQQLFEKLSHYPNITLIQDAEVFELIQNGPKSAVQGAYAWNGHTASTFAIQASAVILCTGGVGSLYRYSTNPSTATGQGVAMAKNVGAEVRDIVNIQFHPTALWQASGTHLPLISEALRGAGAILRDESGRAFMENQHPLRDLAPRDIVARAIVKAISSQSIPYVYLDATGIHTEEWESHFPGILKICQNAGIDPHKTWIPVVPAAHYSCGGVATDVKGVTDIKHLFVLGETACTGLHGANRLASNSLLEATIMATTLAAAIANGSIPLEKQEVKHTPPSLSTDEATVGLAENFLNEVREIMQNNVSVVKTTSGLTDAGKRLEAIEEKAVASLPPASLDLKRLQLSMSTAKMIVADALSKRENKGVFFNEDLTDS